MTSISFGAVGHRVCTVTGRKALHPADIAAKLGSEDTAALGALVLGALHATRDGYAPHNGDGLPRHPAAAVARLEDTGLLELYPLKGRWRLGLAEVTPFGRRVWMVKSGGG